MESITTMIGMTGISAVHGGHSVLGDVSGARRRAGSPVSDASVQRGWKQLPFVPRAVSPIPADNSTGVSVPGRRYRP